MIAPSDEIQLADAVAQATGALRIVGGDTRKPGRPVQGTTLTTRAMSGVTLYEPGALTMVARAGTPVDEIAALLAAEGQMLPFEPMDHRGLSGTSGTPTIGGMVAANVSGPRRIQSGACRDFLLGVRFVDGRGDALSNGGRVMKNVTGYDLARLLAGSHGTLGVLSEVSFKLLPAPEMQAMLLADIDDEPRAIAALGAALGSAFEVTAAARAATAPGGRAAVALRLEGFADSVRYRAGRLQEVLAPFGDWQLVDDQPAVAGHWRAVRDVAVFHGQTGDVWRFSVRPGDGAKLARRIRGVSAAADIAHDWGGGLVWARVPEGTDLFGCVQGGHARLVRADAATRDRLGCFQPEAPAVAALSDALRRQFDPRGILNPGLMS